MQLYKTHYMLHSSYRCGEFYQSHEVDHKNEQSDVRQLASDGRFRHAIPWAWQKDLCFKWKKKIYKKKTSNFYLTFAILNPRWPIFLIEKWYFIRRLANALSWGRLMYSRFQMILKAIVVAVEDTILWIKCIKIWFKRYYTCALKLYIKPWNHFTYVASGQLEEKFTRSVYAIITIYI